MTSPPRFVVDASVGMKWLVAEADSDAADILLDRARAGSIALLAPDVFAPEVANAVWKRARLLREISDEEAHGLIARLQRVMPALVSSVGLLTQALELALAFRAPVYDSLYVALALRDGSTLVSADRALVRAFGAATGRVAHIEDIAFGV